MSWRNAAGGCSTTYGAIYGLMNSEAVCCQAGGVCRMRRVRTRYARAYSSPAKKERSKVKKKKMQET